MVVAYIVLNSQFSAEMLMCEFHETINEKNGIGIRFRGYVLHKGREMPIKAGLVVGMVLFYINCEREMEIS